MLDKVRIVGCPNTLEPGKVVSEVLLKEDKLLAGLSPDYLL